MKTMKTVKRSIDNSPMAKLIRRLHGVAIGVFLAFVVSLIIHISTKL